MSGLITQRRVAALGHICRYNGWVDRMYSVLEHTTIGVTVLRNEGARESVQKTFLLHDFEDTEFGDIVRPVKKKYMNGQYAKDVTAWNLQLHRGHGFAPSASDYLECDDMDNRMIAAELKTVARVGDPEHPYVERMHQTIALVIRLRKFGTHDNAVNGFYEHYHRLFTT